MYIDFNHVIIPKQAILFGGQNPDDNLMVSCCFLYSSFLLIPGFSSSILSASNVSRYVTPRVIATRNSALPMSSFTPHLAK